MIWTGGNRCARKGGVPNLDPFTSFNPLSFISQSSMRAALTEENRAMVRGRTANTRPFLVPLKSTKTAMLPAPISGATGVCEFISSFLSKDDRVLASIAASL